MMFLPNSKSLNISPTITNLETNKNIFSAIYKSTYSTKKPLYDNFHIEVKNI
jgi:hypothetical protein